VTSRGVCKTATRRLWGMRRYAANAPVYDPDVSENRAMPPTNHAEARLRGRNKNVSRISFLCVTLPYFARPGSVPDRQLKQVSIDGDLEPSDTTKLFPQGHSQGLHRRPLPAGKRARTPTIISIIFTACGSEFGTIMAYCSPEGGPPDRISNPSESNQEKTQAAGLGDRAENWRMTRRPIIFTTTPPRATCLSQPRWMGLNADCEQLSTAGPFGRPLARQLRFLKLHRDRHLKWTNFRVTPAVGSVIAGIVSNQCCTRPKTGRHFENV